MTRDELLSQVAAHTGLVEGEAARTVDAVLEVLGARLRWPALQALAEDLPAPWAERLLAGAHGQDFELAQLHARVAARLEVPLGQAFERTGVVCAALADALPPGTLHRLREALPEPMSALLTPRDSEERFEHVHLDPGHRTLSEGRPGSAHPLSEARPERSHSHSVLRADNPHGDTKLSSATGLTQEREHATLATGRPGMRRARGDEED
jgi:uncharacterized protein (DUF2267 family)